MPKALWAFTTSERFGSFAAWIAPISILASERNYRKHISPCLTFVIVLDRSTSIEGGKTISKPMPPRIASTNTSISAMAPSPYRTSV